MYKNVNKLVFAQKVTDKIAKYLTYIFGTVTFLVLFGIFVFGWVVWNEGVFGGTSYDPYPFVFMVMCVQLFEVFLSIIVLISQNREEKLDEVRQQVDLEINVRAEREVTKILEILDKIQKKLGMEIQDDELEEMKIKTDLKEIKEKVEEVLEKDNRIDVDK
jgi:uncharacterized membrane protein